VNQANLDGCATEIYTDREIAHGVSDQ